MQDTIAERQLTYRATNSDVDEPVVVRIGRPSLADSSPQTYAVPFEVHGPGDSHYEGKVYGSDGMQAIGLVFPVINGCIDAIHLHGTLTRNGSSLATHFPT